MIEFFGNVKIRVKLLLAFGSIILVSILLTLYAINSISNIIDLQLLTKESENLSLNIERIELAAKEFIYDGYKQKGFQEMGQSEILDKYKTALYSVNESLKSISKNKFLSHAETKRLVDSLYKSSVITTSFEQTRNLLKKRGFRDYGLEGSLRRAIHKIETSKQSYDRVSMLTLRRHEKDFFLRKDLKYQKEFNTTAVAFAEELGKQDNSELIALLSNYRDEFNQVVEIEKEIGLTDKDGKKGQLFAKLQEVRNIIAKAQSQINATVDTKIANSKIWLTTIFLIQFIAATVLAITYSNVLTKVIKEIKTTMSLLAEGIFPPTLKVNTKEEIGQTKIAINQFLDRMKEATSFAEKLGSGKLNATYDERYGRDVLAKALITMQQKLNEADTIQSKINWSNQGTALFNELLKNDTEDIRILGDGILKILVKHIRANQAALYIINTEEQCLERISTYAYGKKRFLDNRINLDSGLIGQCAKEKETIYLKEIPVDYVKITSGLGEATPRNILIVPLKNRDQINGVLEIASLEIFKENKIEFVEKIVETIAAFIANQKATDQTKKLLEESKLKAENLALQEEELRQSSEELLATQEEMLRQRGELESEIKNLKEKLKVFQCQTEVYSSN